LNSHDIKTRKNARILIVDDHLAARHLYASCLRDHYDITIVSSGDEALQKAGTHLFDLYITDLIMPGMDGITFIKKLRKIHPDAGVIVSSQTEEIDMAVAAFRQKPLEFLRKPIRKTLLINAIERNLEMKSLRENLSALSTVTGQDPSCPEPVFGISHKMSEFWEKVKKVAVMPVNAAVMISGESGSGKEVVARQIHRWSGRNRKPFIAVNCGLLTPELAASELMGVGRGVATGVEPRQGKFTLADGGVIFLDEITELPLAVQPMLLRVLQERTVTPLGITKEIPADVMVLTATNKYAADCVTRGTFREDLFYRLSTVTLEIPPLRRRREDIPGLLNHLYRRHGGSGDLPIDSAEIKKWMEYDWPGNIRQLENALINRLLIGKPFHPEQSAPYRFQSRRDTLDLNGNLTWEEIRNRVFTHAVEQAGGNIREAARKLDIPKSTLWEYMRKHTCPE
jgi:DNA-binding NtrC family response regulator